MARARLLIGAVVVAGSLASWAAGLSSASYVQDGLVVQFDGIENVGVGTHDPSAVKWVNLKGSGSVALNAKGSFGPSFMDAGPSVQSASGMPTVSTASLSLDMAVNVVSNGNFGSGTTWPFIINIGNASYHSSGNASRTFRWYVDNGDPRPDTEKVNTNTLCGVSDAASCRAYKDGVLQQSAAKKAPMNTSTGWTLGTWSGTGGYLTARYFAVRLYNRGLTDEEIAYNAMIDQLRFWAPRYEGGSADWSAAAWQNSMGGAVVAPSTATNGYATVANATVNVAAVDVVALKALSLEDGAKLNLAEGSVVSVRLLYVEGNAIPRGVYTGSEGAPGTPVAWLSGKGVVRVAGSPTCAIPDTLATLDAEGWYEIGDDFANVAWGSSTSSGIGQAACPLASNNTKQFCHGQLVNWSKSTLAFPAGTKLRLKGGVVMDTLPVEWFGEIDVSNLKRLVVYSDKAYSDGRTVVVPSGALFRWQPCTWKMDESTGICWMTDNQPTWTNHKFAEDVEVNGTLHHRGDGTHMNPEWFTGTIGGSGTIVASSFSNQILFNGSDFNFNGTLTCGSNGTGFDILADVVSGEIQSVTMHGCVDQPKYQTNVQYCASGILFGPKTSGQMTQGELLIKSLTGNASDFTDLQQKRWRNGGHVIVHSGNTVHVRSLENSLHVVARKKDQQCVNNRFNGDTSGVGYFIADTLKANVANLFLSTNIYVKVGTVAGATCFNYTYQSNNVNRTTLDITNTCAASARVWATDLEMLPARLSGFTGSISLRDVADPAFQGRVYSLPVDFGAELYNTVGCIGSGTLANAPATGTVNVTLAGEPKIGDFALFRFGRAVDENGQPLFKNWTVTLDGQETKVLSYGSGSNALAVAVVKDATGLWLRVRKSGMTLVVR